MNNTDDANSLNSPANEPPPPLKILLADDMPMNIDLAVKLLTRRGHKVTAVENGQQAVETFQRETFDVILMDVHMPIADGLEATRAIRALEAGQSHIPIIAMTANNDESDKEDCRSAGMDGFITKPIEIKTIVSTIREIIKNTKERL